MSSGEAAFREIQAAARSAATKSGDNAPPQIGPRQAPTPIADEWYYSNVAK